MRNQNGVLRIMWAGLLGSVALYGVIAFVVAPPRADADPSAWPSDPVVLALHLAGFAALAGSFIVPPALARRRAADPEVVARQTWVLRWALLESAGVFGLIVALVLRDARGFVLLGALSILGLLLAFPRTDDSSRAAI